MELFYSKKYFSLIFITKGARGIFKKFSKIHRLMIKEGLAKKA
jgi:hypothetical protein